MQFVLALSSAAIYLTLCYSSYGFGFGCCDTVVIPNCGPCANCLKNTSENNLKFFFSVLMLFELLITIRFGVN